MLTQNINLKIESASTVLVFILAINAYYEVKQYLYSDSNKIITIILFEFMLIMLGSFILVKMQNYLKTSTFIAIIKYIDMLFILKMLCTYVIFVISIPFSAIGLFRRYNLKRKYTVIQEKNIRI